MKNSKQQLKDLVEEQRMAEVKDRPQILQRSKQIMEQNRLSEIPAYARLYYLHKKDGAGKENIDHSNQSGSLYRGIMSFITNIANPQEKYYKSKDNYEQIRNQIRERESKENTFKPAIHQKSKSLVRNEKVEVILYKDAKRRLEKQRKESKKRSNSCNSGKISSMSEIILVHKFTKEFYQVCQQLNLQDKDSFDLNNVFELLIKLRFIKYYYEQDGPVIENEKRLVYLLWSLIGGERFGKIKKENLVIFLLCVLGLGLNRKVNDKEIELIMKNNLQQMIENNQNYQGNFSGLASQLFNGSNILNNPSQRIQTEPNGANRMNGDDHYNPQSPTPHKLITAAQQINSGCYDVSSSNSKSNNPNLSNPFFATFQNLFNQNTNNLHPTIQSCNSVIKTKTSLDVNKDSNSHTNISFQVIGGGAKHSLSSQKLPQVGNTIEQFRIQEMPEAENEQQKLNTNFGSDKKNGISVQTHSNIFNHEISKSIYNIQLGYFEEDTNLWILGLDDKRVIHQAFEVLYRNRLAYEELKNNKYDWEYSFQPQLTTNSIQLANRQREKVLTEAAHLLETQQIKMKIPEDGKICHQQLLVLQKMANDLNIKKKKEVLDQQQLQECSFYPQINTFKMNTLPDIGQPEKGNNQNTNIYDLASAVLGTDNQINSRPRLTTVQSSDRGVKKTEELYQMPNPKQHRRDKTREEIEYEKVCDECTFHPEITKKKRVYKQEQLYAKNIDKTIDRLRNAYKEKEQITIAKKKGHTRHSLGGISDFKPESTKHSKMSNKNSVSNLTHLRSPSNLTSQTNNKPPIPSSTSNRNIMKNLNNLSGQFQFDQSNTQVVNYDQIKHSNSSNNLHKQNNDNNLNYSNNSSFNQRAQNNFFQDKKMNNKSDQNLRVNMQMEQYQQQQQQQLQQTQHQQFQFQNQQQQQQLNQTQNLQQQIYEQPELQESKQQQLFQNQIQQQQQQQQKQQYIQQQQQLQQIQQFNSSESSNNSQKNNQYSSYSSSESQSNNRNYYQQTQLSPVNNFNNQNMFQQKQIADSQQPQSSQAMNIQELYVQSQSQQQSQQKIKNPSQTTSQQSNNSISQDPSSVNQTYHDRVNSTGNQNQNQLIPDQSFSQTPNKSATSSLSLHVKSEEKVPLLFVDVNLGLGRIERIVVYEGDKSEDLANKFALVHNLDTVTKQKFKELLDNQIAGLLSRIDEEEMLSYESESQNHSAIHQHHYYFQNYNSNGSNYQMKQSSSLQNTQNQNQNNSQHI
ncbi:hypothetical protein TTHERM_00697380 (macronuclear) [Tetrahymena thermophila SB210]|uniref:Uncharacterized protein n=1 Tax=Tetrahymena thermophila (strain SB210) TaxID=312017 RepID=Q24C38_TETTS|nr:hypothetical protein TTHERM_00697380 [Tetrahymena thermophila SB210]EAS05400.2 hypothetical protein TTHERM_00697380 [Tetrahymena thermophila SB210]|eukprot:XP_001025645.2 hypothetical protein TTHERM_00697380 [Tetrahymena thermophila SB210]